MLRSTESLGAYQKNAKKNIITHAKTQNNFFSSNQKNYISKILAAIGSRDNCRWKF